MTEKSSVLTELCVKEGKSQQLRFSSDIIFEGLFIILIVLCVRVMHYFLLVGFCDFVVRGVSGVQQTKPIVAKII